MLIYRPFIPPPPLLPSSLRERSQVTVAASAAPLPFPALAICITSARACTRILEHQLGKRSWDYIHIPNFVHAAYLSAGLFLLAFWDLKGQQKAVVKIQSAGVINSANGDLLEKGDASGLDPPDSEGHQESPSTAPPPWMADDGLDPEQVLQTLKAKMAELLRDIRVLLSALEWVEPRWQFVSPMLEQLRMSMPVDEDLEMDPLETKGTVVLKKLSFQDLRRQRQQQKLGKKSPQPNHAFFGFDPSGIETGMGSGIPDPSAFLQEYPNLHTLNDEDFEDFRDGSDRLPRGSYGSMTMGSTVPHSANAYDEPQLFSSRHPSYPATSSPVPPQAPLLAQSLYHDNRRPSYQSDTILAHPQSAAAYADGDYSRPSSYISGSIGLTPSIDPREHQGYHRPSLPYPHHPTIRLDDYTNDVRLDSKQIKLTPSPAVLSSADLPIAASSRSPTSLRPMMDNRDVVLSPVVPSPTVRHGYPAVHMMQPGEDRRYAERHSDIRTDIHPSQPQGIE